MKNKNERIRKNELKKEALIESLKFPKDICMGAVKVTLTGNREAWIENYKGIIEYTPERIFLQLKNGRVAFCGKQLHIAFYTSEEMRITGIIEGMQFLC